MSPENVMKRRVNALFFVLCLTVAIQFVLGYFLQALESLRQIGVPISDYVMTFVAPQFLFPVLNLMLVFVSAWVLRLPLRTLLRVSAPRREFLPWLGLFLGVATASNYLVNWFVFLLEKMGISVPDVFSQYIPETPAQAVGFFVVIVLLPSISEEVLFRGMTAGGLREFHPGAAVLLSALAFGFMHANLQQIPFATLLGLVLGFVYIKTGNILYPILLHLVNNGWACLVTLLGAFGTEEVALAVQGWGNLLFLILGAVCFVWLLRKKAFSLKEYPRTLTGGQAFRGAVFSLGMWIFFALYLLLTVLTLVVPTA